MKKNKEGWWQIFRQPEVDDAGQWSITEENTKTGEITIHLYDDEAAAQDAYQALFQSMLNRGRH